MARKAKWSVLTRQLPYRIFTQGTRQQCHVSQGGHGEANGINVYFFFHNIAWRGLKLTDGCVATEMKIKNSQASA